MASGGGNVKRGFGTYLLIFLFMIVLAFVLVVMIMMLKPFKTILNLKYFVHRDKYVVTATTDDEEINYSALQELNINTNYADVEIVRNAKIEAPEILIQTNAFGFAKGDQNTDFTYSVNYVESDPTKLNITVSEPSGFLFFDKQITISYRIPTSQSSSLESTKINVVNTSGKLTLGNDREIKVGNPIINLSNVHFKTTKGTLVINKYVGDSMNELFFKSESGGLQNYKDLQINDKLTVYSTKGNLKLGTINYTGADAMQWTLGNSKFQAKSITGNVELDIGEGYLEVDKLNGNLTSDDSLNEMGAATINIKEIDGNVSFPYSNTAKIHLGKVYEGKQVYINGTKGNVTIDEMNGGCWIETTKGNVSVHTYSNDIWVKTTSGTINVSYDNDDIYDTLDFISEKGNVNLKVRSELKFIMKAYNSKGEYRGSANINIDFYGKEFHNPLVINEGTKVINITTNSKINISLL